MIFDSEQGTATGILQGIFSMDHAQAETIAPEGSKTAKYLASYRAYFVECDRKKWFPSDGRFCRTTSGLCAQVTVKGVVHCCAVPVCRTARLELCTRPYIGYEEYRQVGDLVI